MSIDLTTVATGARSPHPGFFSIGARPFPAARFRRRARILASQAIAIFRLRKGARALAPAAAAFVGGLVWLGVESHAFAGQFGGCALPTLALFACLSVAALIDARYFILPDGPLILLAIVGAAMRLSWSGFALSPDFISSIAAAAFAFALFRAIGWSFEKWRGYPGLGAGDARLFAVAGLWLGWAGLPTCLMFATASAAIAIAIAKRDGAIARLRDPIPFGPHLAVGFWLVWTAGPLVAA